MKADDFPVGGTALSADPIWSLRIRVNKHLPVATIEVSPDVWASIKRQFPDQGDHPERKFTRTRDFGGELADIIKHYGASVLG